MSREPVDCRRCKRSYRPGIDPDPCLGELPGVLHACCGHGDPHMSYVVFENGVTLRGMNSIEHFTPGEGTDHTKTIDNGRREHGKQRMRQWSGASSHPDDETWRIPRLDN